MPLNVSPSCEQFRCRENRDIQRARVMRDLMVRLLQAVYQYEKERDRLLRENGIELGHNTLIERIARRYGQSREEKLFILQTLANFRGQD